MRATLSACWPDSESIRRQVSSANVVRRALKLSGWTMTLLIIIIHEDEGFGCGCLDDLDFLLLGPSVADIKARLPKALEDHFGHPVAYRIVSEPEGDRLH